MPAWSPPQPGIQDASSTLANSWITRDSAPRYHKIGTQVYLEGEVGNGVADATIITLPPGYRPTVVQIFLVRGHTGAAEATPLVTVHVDGTVTANQAIPRVRLDGINFYAG